MSFKRLMLIISVVVGTVFAGSASRANTFAQDTARAESDKISQLTRGRAPAMEEDFAVPMHGGDPTMEEHFDPAHLSPAMEEDFAVPMHIEDTMEEAFDAASFTPVGGEDYRSRSSTKTIELHGDYNFWMLEFIMQDWQLREECAAKHQVAVWNLETERRECRDE
jgi:hypothetical protein